MQAAGGHARESVYVVDVDKGAALNTWPGNGLQSEAERQQKGRCTTNVVDNSCDASSSWAERAE